MTIRRYLLIGLYGALTMSAFGKAYEMDISFPFRAGKHDLPSGRYSFVCDNSTNTVTIKGAGATVSITADTRLRGPTASQNFEGTLVFDQGSSLFGDKDILPTLSEVWVGGEDGYQVGSVRGEVHTHRVVVGVEIPTEMLSGKEIFVRTCQVCHGADGAGNRAADEFFGLKLPRLNSAYVQAKSDAELRQIIVGGNRRMDPVRFQESDGARHVMPAYAVDPVIAYVRSLGGKP
jgi:hypothetical protein